MHKIAVIIPVYNTEQYLKRCIESVISQSLTDIEIICVNDGSSDNSLNILNGYAAKDSRIKLINQENKGVSSARNIAIDNNNSEYIFFLDSDDWIEDDCLKILYNSAKSSSADITFGAVNTYSKNRIESCDIKQIKNIQKYDNFVCKLASIGGKLYKKSFVINKNIKFPNDLVMGEDGYFNYISLLKNAKFKIIPHIVYNYQSSRLNSATKNYTKHTDYNAFIKILTSEIFKKTSYENKKIYFSMFINNQIYWFYKNKQDFNIYQTIKKAYCYILENNYIAVVKNIKSYNHFKYIAESNEMLNKKTLIPYKKSNIFLRIIKKIFYCIDDIRNNKYIADFIK